MRLSLIATTRQRDPQYLARLFASLASQTCTDFSLILGDQNPPGFLDTVLRGFEGKFPRMVIPLEPCGLSEARNRLIPFAEGDFLALTDDDCHYAPDAFFRLFRASRDLPDAAAITGKGAARMLTPPGDASLPPVRLSRYGVFRDTPSWCIFLRRTDALQTGPFDTHMGLGSGTPWLSGEETDFLVRMIDSGKKIYHDPGIRIFHDSPHDSPEEPDIAKVYGYAMGRMYLLEKHRFPLWFKLLNILFPLACLFREVPVQGTAALKNRLAMFRGRLSGFFAAR